MASRLGARAAAWQGRIGVPVSWLGRTAVIAGVLLAIAAGGLGGWLAGERFNERRATASSAAGQTIAVGTAELRLADSWSPVGRTRDLAGSGLQSLRAFAPFTGLPGRSWLGVGPLDGPSLVPAAVRAQLRSPLPAPAATRLAGQPAWSYGNLELRNGRRLALTVVPTATNVLVLGCESERASWNMVAGCASDVQALGGVGFVAPQATLALHRRLGTIVRHLNVQRAVAARALGAAKRALGQRRAAGRLASIHRVAAAKLAALVPATPAGRAPVKALDRAASAYTALGAAVGTHLRPVYRRARIRVRRAERALQTALRTAARP
jgi:hypothetical protein